MAEPLKIQATVPFEAMVSMNQITWLSLRGSPPLCVQSSVSQMI